jgi:hypothetical protein
MPLGLSGPEGVERELDRGEGREADRLGLPEGGEQHPPPCLELIGLERAQQGIDEPAVVDALLGVDR